MSGRRDEALAIVGRVCARPVESLRPEQTLAGDLEIDSVRGLDLLFTLEERLGISIDEPSAAGFRTLGDVLAYVERASGGGAG